MHLFVKNNQFEEDEEGIDDALLGELDAEEVDDEDVDPLLKAAVVDPLALEEEEEEDPLKEDPVKIFDEADEDADVDDYDSFDDHDEM